MLFYSIEFLFFLPIAFSIYWYVLGGSFNAQNFFLLVANYVFYGWWGWRFLTLIFASSLIVFLLPENSNRNPTKHRKSWSYAQIWCLRGLNRWRPLLVVNA